MTYEKGDALERPSELIGPDELPWWRWLRRSAGVGRIDTPATRRSKRLRQSRQARRTSWHRPRRRRPTRGHLHRTLQPVGGRTHRLSPSVTRAIEHVLKQTSDHPRAAVLDFSARSSTPRFHVIDRASGQVLQSFRVSHGHGSEGKRDDGYAEVFSNEPGSNASSLGLYRTGETYRSHVYPGLSMRLDGLSSTNSNARSRFIVIHEAWYMDPESWKGKKMGRPGRSEGCFVFSKADRDAVIAHLKGGALIYASYEKSR